MERLDIKKCIIVPDIHGCYEELIELIDKLKANGFDPSTDPERKFIFLGDWIDRGYANDKVIEYIIGLMEDGLALSVIGNHEEKLKRYLRGNNVKLINGIESTVKQIDARPNAAEFRIKVLAVLEKLPLHIVLDNKKLVVVHAGIQDRMLSWTSEEGFMTRFCLYGDITGKKDAYGFPERLDWTLNRQLDENSPLIVYGHQPQLEPYENNKTINLDCGLVFGNKLVALVYPEMQYISVFAKKEYWEFKNGKYKNLLNKQIENNS